MSTLTDKLRIAKKLENKSNDIRTEISELNYEKSLRLKLHKDTGDIDSKLEKLRDELSTTWSAFEVLRDELGDNYNYRIGDEKND